MHRIAAFWLSSILVPLGPFLLLGPPSARAGVNHWTSNGPDLPAVQVLAIAPTNPRIVYAGT